MSDVYLDISIRVDYEDNRTGMDVANRSGSLILFVTCWFTIAHAGNAPRLDPSELLLVERVENQTVQGIQLLNDTEAYNMSVTISDSVEDTLKLFDDLGPLFRNGTLATYMCVTDNRDRQLCDIFALPNGSLPLQKGFIKLMFDGFNVTKSKYSDLTYEHIATGLVRKWFSRRSREGLLDYSPLNGLDVALGNNIVAKISQDYEKLLNYANLQVFLKSISPKNAGRNLITWLDFEEFKTRLLSEACNRTELIEVIYALMGSHCANESFDVSEYQSAMIKTASLGNFNGGDSNRCLPEFVIRYNNYNEALYKVFVTDISTFIHHELNLAGFCHGIREENNAQREVSRSRLSEQVREMMQRMLDARVVLIEEPPTKPTTPSKPTKPTTSTLPTTTTLPGLPSSGAVKAEVTNALANVSENLASLPWKDRSAVYDEAIRNAVPKLKTGYNITWPLTCVCITQKLCFCGPTGNVDGVLYLPYDMSNRRMHCAQATDYGGYWGSIPEMANYFVKYTHTAVHAKTMKQKLKPKFAALEASKDSIVKAVFAGNHDDLCIRVIDALRDKAVSGGIEGTGFSAFVAVRCAYDFVWYELGWRYYTAARTTSDYVLEKYDGTFNANCGQLIFLP